MVPTPNKSTPTETSSIIDRREYLKFVGSSAGLAIGGLGAGQFGSIPASAASSDPTVLDDFEDGDISEYDGNTSDYTVQGTTTIESSQTLKATSTYAKIGHSSAQVSRGHEYRCRIMAGNGSTAKPCLLTCVQNASYPFSDCYCAFVDIPNNELRLLRKDGGNNTWLDTVTVTIDEATEYLVGIHLYEEKVKVVLYDASGNVLAATNAVKDTTYTDGTFGFYTGGGTPAYFDYVTERPVDDALIEGFEDGDLNEYIVDRGSGHSIVTAPTFSGNRALEMADDSATEIISTSGLNAYPTVGDRISVRFRTNGTGNGQQANFSYGVQDHKDRYFVNLDPGDQTIRLFKYSDGNSIVLSDTIPASFNADEWYRLNIYWATDGTHTARLFDSNGTQVAKATGTDSTWNQGGIGFDAYLSSGQAVYFDQIQFDSGYEVIDGFENGTFDAYSFDRGESGASIVHEENSDYSGSNNLGSAYDGEYSLEISGTNTELISTNGLNTYPAAGDSIGCWVMATGGAAQLNFTYGVQDHDNRYFVNVNFDSDKFSLFKYENASSIILDKTDANVALVQDTWYWIEVEWGLTGDHEAYLYDTTGAEIAKASVENESTWTTGGIGYDAYLSSSGGTVYFDHVILGTYETIEGWGTEVLNGPPTYGRDDDNDPNWDYVEDFQYRLHYGGLDAQNEHVFTVGLLAHNYHQKDDVDNPGPNDLAYETNLESVELEVGVTDLNGNDVSDQVLLDRTVPHTDLIAITTSRWREWVDNNHDLPDDPDEVKSLAFDEGVLTPEANPDGPAAVISLMLSAFSIYAYPYIAGGGSVLIGGASLVVDWMTEDVCGFTSTEVDTDHERVIFDPCDLNPPLIGYIIQYELEVPNDLGVTVTIDQRVNQPARAASNANNNARWEFTIPAGETAGEPTGDTFE